MTLLALLQITIISVLIKNLKASYNVPTLQRISSLSVPVTANGYDPCRFFQIRNQTLYRMGESNIISRWNLSSFAYIQQNYYQTLDWSQNISNLAIGFQTRQIVATLQTLAPDIKFDIIDPLTIVMAQSYVLTASGAYTTIKVIATQTQYLHFLYSYSNYNTLIIYDKNMIFKQQIYFGATGFMNSTICEDESAVILWDANGKAFFVYQSGSSWIFYSIYTPDVINSAMNSITMSKNGSVVILQYDSYSPLAVVNFRTLFQYSSKSFTNTIVNQAVFLDEDCHLIALTVNYTTVQIYDTLTLTLQSTTAYGTVSNYSVVDYSSGTLYFCLPQNIQVFKIICPTLAYRNIVTNQCINCIVSSNCNGCDQDTGICNSCVQNFTLNISNFQCQPDPIDETNSSSLLNTTNSVNETNSTIIIGTNSTNNGSNLTNNSFANTTNNNFTNSTSNNETNSSYFNTTNTNWTNSTIFPNQQHQIDTISPTQAFIANLTIETFNSVSPVITTVFSIIQISPFTLIFIGFMNYWNLCCLYSILDVKVPGYLPEIHEKIFQAIQTSIFQNFGLNPKLQSLDNQTVSSTYFKANYNISLDFINPNFQNTMMVFFVLVLILITICFRNVFLRKSSFLYNLLKFSILQSLIGQFISFVPFCILPYRFLVNKTGVQNFSQKLNLILQVFLLILCFLAPCLFIWSRSQTYIESQVKKSKLFKQISKDSLKSKNLMQKIKSKDAKTQNQNFKELQMLIVNISVPLLIILPIYYPFFIVNLTIFFYSIKKASKSSNYRINSIITACYLPLYHTCYIIFSLFGQNELICHYVGLFCLVVLFLGGIHELCNVVFISLFEIIKWLIKTSKQHCLSSKISNQPQKSQLNNLKSIEFNILKSYINIENRNKVANSYNQEYGSKENSFKWQSRANQQADDILDENPIKNRVRAIKFKIQRTYKRGMEINQTLKPSFKKSFKKQKNNIAEESGILQSQENFRKKQQNIGRNRYKQQNMRNFNKVHLTYKQQRDMLNQMLKKDYILRQMSTGKKLPKYRIV